VHFSFRCRGNRLCIVGTTSFDGDQETRGEQIGAEQRYHVHKVDCKFFVQKFEAIREPLVKRDRRSTEKDAKGEEMWTSEMLARRQRGLLPAIETGAVYTSMHGRQRECRGHFTIRLGAETLPKLR
jgi:hypothetical protein